MSKRIVIIDYGSGNLRSAAKSCERVVAEEGLDCEVLVSADPADLSRASHILLPGVGAYGDCRAGLDAVDGMVEALREQVEKEAKPFLGVCVGMQLMSTRGLEYGTHEGLGWIDADCIHIAPEDPSLKVPHMGWNDLKILIPGHPVFEGISDGDHAYFVHSYHLSCRKPAEVAATVDYGHPLTAIVARDNMVGVQFHPEKSQQTGLRLIGNFLRWTA
jgi:glutamine amidotransferase